MTYTIRSAQWGNEAHTSAVIDTVEVNNVAISLADTPQEWAAFLIFASTHIVAEVPVIPLPPVLTKAERLDRMLASRGLTLADLKTLLGVP